MNPLALIPAPWLIWVRIAVVVLLAGLCFGTGCKVTSWRDASAIADVKVAHSQAIADATARTHAAQLKVDAEHQLLADHLAADSSDRFKELNRREREIDTLRPAVADGSRVVRVADATCPGGPGDLPKATGGGRVDPAAGAVLSAAAGQTVLDLRASITGTEHQLAACQAAVKCITGQGACPSAATP